MNKFVMIALIASLSFCARTRYGAFKSLSKLPNALKDLNDTYGELLDRLKK